MEDSRSFQKENTPKKKHSKRAVIELVVGTAAAVSVVILVGRKINLKSLLSSTPEHTEPPTDGIVDAVVKATNPCTTDAATQTPKQIEVNWFIRTLPESQNASPQARAYANSLGVKLAEGQTIVRPQTRSYGQAA